MVADCCLLKADLANFVRPKRALLVSCHQKTSPEERCASTRHYSLIFQISGFCPDLLTELAPAAYWAVVAEASSGRSLHLSGCDQWLEKLIGLASLPSEAHFAHRSIVLHLLCVTIFQDLTSSRNQPSAFSSDCLVKLSSTVTCYLPPWRSELRQLPPAFIPFPDPLSLFPDPRSPIPNELVR